MALLIGKCYYEIGFLVFKKDIRKKCYFRIVNVKKIPIHPL